MRKYSIFLRINSQQALPHTGPRQKHIQWETSHYGSMGPHLRNIYDSAIVLGTKGVAQW